MSVTDDRLARRPHPDAEQATSDESGLLLINERLRALNRVHSVLSQAAHAMMRALEQGSLLAEMCHILVTTGEFAAAAFVTQATATGDPVMGTSAHSPDGADAGPILTAMSEAVRAMSSEGRVSDATAASVDGGASWSSRITLLPVEARDDLAGVLAVCVAPDGKPVDAEEHQLLSSMARELGFALDALASDRRRAAAVDLSEKLAVQQALISTLGFLALGRAGPVELFDTAFTALEPFGERQVILYEVRTDGASVVARAVSGARVPISRGDVVARSALPVTNRVLTTGERLVVNDFSNDPRFVDTSATSLFAVGSGVSVPIRVDGATVAALTVHSFAANDFGSSEVAFYNSVAHVISGGMERSRYRDSVRHEAMHDRLTGLPNRLLFEDRLAQALARYERRQAGPLAVLIADVDVFKAVNVQLGHEVGDRVLRLAGARLREAVRPSDTVARLGGDEYVLLCEDLVNANEAATVARRITERLRDPFAIFGGRTASITMSVGVAVGSEGSTPAGLLRDAEAAMYRAKEAGRDRFELFDEALRTRLLHRADLEVGLRSALDRNEFVVAYQPIVEVATGVAREAEALLRWTRSDGTIVSPAEFIPIAEDTGTIVAIGAWVLRQACADAVRWNVDSGCAADVSVGVNLSARQIGDKNLVATVRQVLEDTGLAPRLLRLEITETALMEDAVGATATLEGLRRLGVQLSVDDFGTGYSSLMYLRRFPVSILKIDRYFVAGLGRNPEDDAIVQAVIALAHSLGLSATAEGVETLDQLQRLRALGCDSAQGFLWSKAVELLDFIPLIARINSSVGDPAEHSIAPSPPTGQELDSVSASGSHTVALVDDSPSDRGLLRIALEACGQFTVVGEAGDGASAVALAARTHPEVLFLDMSMTGMNGLEALGPIQAASPGTRVVFLSGFLSGALSDAVARAGAFAQFDKSVPLEALVPQLICLLDVQRARTPVLGSVA